MAPTLYMVHASPAVRSVLLCAKALGVELNLKNVDLRNGEHLKPEFHKLNPQHTVPVLDDDGFILVDSHAIMTYLVSKYGKDDRLYPKDIKQRAIIDHRLHYDSGVFFARAVIISKGIIFEGDKEPNPRFLALLEDAYKVTEEFLEKYKFVAGDHLTVADFSYVTTISTCNVFYSFDESKYPKIAAWLKEMKSLPYYEEANQYGLNLYVKLIETRLMENNK